MDLEQQAKEPGNGKYKTSLERHVKWDNGRSKMTS